MKVFLISSESLPLLFPICFVFITSFTLCFFFVILYYFRFGWKGLTCKFSLMRYAPLEQGTSSKVIKTLFHIQIDGQWGVSSLLLIFISRI